jgi:type II secretory pathway component GspD/PulD (secretin)
MKTRKRILAAIAALGCLLAPPAHAQISDAHVSLRVEGRELSEVVQYLREQSGSNIVVVQGGETQISLDLTDVPWRDALDLAAELANCVVEERTAGVLAVVLPPRVDFAFDDAPLRQVIDTIGKLSGANIVVAPEVAGTLSLRLQNVPWRDALEVAVKTLGYTIVEENRGILRIVDPLSLQAQMETRSYQLRYVRPPSKYLPIIQSEFVQSTEKVQQKDVTGEKALEQVFPLLSALKKGLSPGGQMDYIRQSNVLIVRDTIQAHTEIGDILEKLDIEPAQVFIDVKFVSTNNADLYNLGVDYGEFGPQISMGGGSIPITLPFQLGAGGFEDAIIADPSGTGPFVNEQTAVIPKTVFGSLSFTGFQGTLRMLQRDTNTEVVQAPKLIALDGREATIFVGETIRYAQAKSEQGQAGGLQLSVEEAASSPVETGFQLLVIPHVIPGANKVIMDIIPKETSLTGVGDPTVAPPGFDVFTVGASGLEGSIALPRERSSTIVTSMMLESGQTAVIGGLTTEFDQETQTQIPGLHKIPLLGWFFEHEDRSRAKTSLLVFVTPTVVRSAAETQRLLDREIYERHGSYGERIRQILYGDDADFDAGHASLTPNRPQGSTSSDDVQVATFVTGDAASTEATAPEAVSAAND